MDFANGKHYGKRVFGGLVVFEANESGDGLTQLPFSSAIVRMRIGEISPFERSVKTS